MLSHPTVATFNYETYLTQSFRENAIIAVPKALVQSLQLKNIHVR